MNRVLLAGLTTRDSAAMDILIGMTWRNLECITLERQLSKSMALDLPEQDAAARACQICIVDLAGLGLRNHSAKAESRLLEFLAERPALLLLRGDGNGWLNSKLARPPSPLHQFVAAPYTAAKIRRALDSARRAAGLAEPSDHRPHPEKPARQEAVSAPAWKRALAFRSTRDKASARQAPLDESGLEPVFQAFPELRDQRQLRFINKLLLSSDAQLLKVGKVIKILLHPAEGWLATTQSLTKLGRLQNHPVVATSVETIPVPDSQVESVARECYGRDYQRLQLPLDLAVWELASEAISGLDLSRYNNIGFQLTCLPNLAHIRHVRPIDIQLSVICARVPQTIDSLINAFDRNRADVLRFVALSLAAGLARTWPASGHEAVSSAPPLESEPLKSSDQHGFFRSLLDKLLN